MSVQTALWHFPFLLDNFIKLDVIKKKVSFIHTAFFNLEDESDVKPKGKRSYWRFRVFSVGKKVTTFVRHSVSYSPCKGAVKYMQGPEFSHFFPPTTNFQSTLIRLNIEMMFGAETSCTSGTVSYRKMWNPLFFPYGLNHLQNESYRNNFRRGNL